LPVARAERAVVWPFNLRRDIVSTSFFALRINAFFIRTKGILKKVVEKSRPNLVFYGISDAAGRARPVSSQGRTSETANAGSGGEPGFCDVPRLHRQNNLFRKREPGPGRRLSADPGFAARAKHLNLKSSSVLVVEQGKGRLLYAKNTQAVVPIASITKLMTAMVALDAQLALDETVRISEADIDDIKGTRSRLKIGAVLTRSELCIWR